jgi:protein-S-isoprenylcysteine O-methyltransferase Ste14
LTSFGWVALALWVVWFAYWGLSALGRPKLSRSDAGPSFLAYRVANITAILFLLFPRFRDTWINTQVFEPAAGIMVAGLVLTLAGLAISVWARIHLGEQWTGRVGVREGHELVRSGPYRFVRHPIYSGMLLAFIGTALVYCDWRSLVAIALMTAALSYKLQREERWMREHFAADYQAYLRKVAAIIPGVL